MEKTEIGTPKWPEKGGCGKCGSAQSAPRPLLTETMPSPLVEDEEEEGKKKPLTE